MFRNILLSIGFSLVLLSAPCGICAGSDPDATQMPPVSGAQQTGIPQLIPALVPKKQDASQPPLAAPYISISPRKQNRLERRSGFGRVLERQWAPQRPLPLELQPGGLSATREPSGEAEITLKRALYIAIRNNPGLRADMLDPTAALEKVRQANAAFDPYVDSKFGVQKKAIPAITNYSSVGQELFARKQWDWDLGVNKLLSTTNGTLGIGFDNNRISSNARNWMVNPSYNPELVFSLSQPLLRHFGLGFATINVRIADTAYARVQYTLEQRLSDFALETATDYWNVVRARENVQVSRGALQLALNTADLDMTRLRMGMAAQIDVQESQSAVETARAALSSALHQLDSARALLREQVMFNSRAATIPEAVEPSESPGEDTRVEVNDTEALDLAMASRPELGALRESIREEMLRVRVAENQTLPQLNLNANFGIAAVSGTAGCAHVSSSVNLDNCTAFTQNGPQPGTQLRLGGTYADALNRLLSAGFYTYAIGITLQIPISNDYANATLAQARVQSNQARLQYREQVSKIIADVQIALSGLRTAGDRTRTTRAAATCARNALEAENARYRAGVANTHELLQYQQELISALAAQLQANVDLEIARLQLAHAEGTLLRKFQIQYAVDDTVKVPWYAHF